MCAKSRWIVRFSVTIAIHSFVSAADHQNMRKLIIAVISMNTPLLKNRRSAYHVASKLGRLWNATYVRFVFVWTATINYDTYVMCLNYSNGG
jgi:hypothetical protein